MTPKPLFLAALGLVGGLFLATCGPALDPLAPPEIHYGEDVCDACQMIISDPRFAAATIVEIAGGSEPRIFDDIGDLVDSHAEDLETVVLAWYVHDYDSESWIDAREAHYVRAEAIRSPMAYGLAAFADPDRAEIFAVESQGETLDFETLLGRPVSALTPNP